MTSKMAKKAVNAIIYDLSDRKGLGDEWDQIDSDTLKEIKDEWAKMIDHAFGTEE